MNNKENPCVFLELSINGIPAERMVIELFADEVPKTAENFRALCTGGIVQGQTTLHYKGTEFCRIYRGVCAEGVDFSNQNQNQNGTGGGSVNGKLFADEKIKPRQSEYGVLAVFPSTQGFKFYIILETWQSIDGGRPVFGQVIEGMETVKKIEEMGTPNAKPSGQVKITDCGELLGEAKKKYMMGSSHKGKKNKRWKRAKPSTYVSEFYSSKRKFSLPSESCEADILSSLRAKLIDGGKLPQDYKDIVMEPARGCYSCQRYIAYQNFLGKNKKTGKKTISSEAKSDGRVTKERVSTFVDERPPSDISEVDLMVLAAEFYKPSEDVIKKLELDKGKKEKSVSSNESSDAMADLLPMLPNHYLEFYHSKKKYWSSELSKSGYYFHQKNNEMEVDKGTKIRTLKRVTRRPLDRGGYMKSDGGKRKIAGKRISQALDSGEISEGQQKIIGKRGGSSNSDSLDSGKKKITWMRAQMEFFDEGKKEIITGMRGEESDSECYSHLRMYHQEPKGEVHPKSSYSYSTD